MSFRNVHNTRDVLFRPCANTNPQRDSIFIKGPDDVLDHVTKRNRHRQRTRHWRDENSPAKTSNAPGRR